MKNCIDANIDLPEILRHVIMFALRRPSGQIRPVTVKMDREEFPGTRLIKQESIPTSGVLQSLHMEDVARSWWGPSACRANFLRCVTAYANLDD